MLLIELAYYRKERIPEALFEKVCNLINKAYHNSEKELWKREVSRVNKHELLEAVANGSLIVARNRRHIVGTVVVKPIVDGKAVKFEMLCVADAYRKKGVGLKLVEAIENWALQNHLYHIQLELLAPVEWRHPEKEFLKKWYRKLGYRPTAKIAFESMFPKRYRLLSCQCDFTVWEKKLTTATP